MNDHLTDESRQIVANPALATAAFVQAWENVRHIRNERIWFANAYTAVVAGGLAVLQRDNGASTSAKMLTTIGLLVLLLFSLASLLSSIRLVAELRHAIANVRRAIDELGMDRIVGLIEAPHDFGASLPVRWVFPMFFGLTTAALVVLLAVHLVQ